MESGTAVLVLILCALFAAGVGVLGGSLTAMAICPVVLGWAAFGAVRILPAEGPLRL
ncbi:hypothetical protein [Nocardia sp. NPDC057440]|uniref:hypothetical protein n=1 Tax=Nocardia sp. NPDC057440 TaxID=3346134 RepID=UPI00366D2A97